MRKYYNEDFNEEYERGFRAGRREALRELNESDVSDDASDYQTIIYTYKYKSLLQYYKSNLVGTTGDLEIELSSHTLGNSYTDTEKEKRQLVFEVVDKKEKQEGSEDYLKYQIFVTLEPPHEVEVRIYDHLRNKNLRGKNFDVLSDSVKYIKSIISKR